MSGSRNTKVAEAEAKVAALEAKLEQLTQLMAAQATTPRVMPVVNTQAMVGVRNISSYVLGFIDTTSPLKTSYQLEPHRPNLPDGGPGTSAVIPFSLWQVLRRQKQVAKGMLVRDDSVLGPVDAPAPEDRPEDVHPDAVKNRMLDPIGFIELSTEDAIRDRITEITSDATLWRLRHAIDLKILEVGRQFGDDPDIAAKALRVLPAKYKYVEALVDERLDEMSPHVRDRERDLEPIQDVGKNPRLL